MEKGNPFEELKERMDELLNQIMELRQNSYEPKQDDVVTFPELMERTHWSRGTITGYMNLEEDPLPSYQYVPGGKFEFKWSEVEDWKSRHRN